MPKFHVKLICNKGISLPDRRGVCHWPTPLEPTHPHQDGHRSSSDQPYDQLRLHSAHCGASWQKRDRNTIQHHFRFCFFSFTLLLHRYFRQLYEFTMSSCFVFKRSNFDYNSISHIFNAFLHTFLLPQVAPSLWTEVCACVCKFEGPFDIM